MLWQSRDLEVTQNTAWFSAHRIRKAFEGRSDNALLSPTEMDETRAGESLKNKRASKKTEGTQGRRTRSAVAGIKSGADRKIKTRVTETIKKEELQNMIKETVTDGSTVYKDDNPGYNGLSKKGYAHERVNHSVGEYIKGRARTNRRIESFRSAFKRGYTGTYHTI